MLRSTGILALLAAALCCADASAWPRRAHEDCSCAGPATIVIKVPEDAAVFLNGQPTTPTGPTRVFETPTLMVGWKYHYSVKVQVGQGGDGQSETRDITTQPFCTTEVDFTNLEEAAGSLPRVKDPPKLPESFFPSELP